MNKFVFICGASRSGTNLLSNLLDGHPGVYMHPIETRVLINWNYHKARNSVERFFLRDIFNTEEVHFFTCETARKEHTEFVKQAYGVEDTFKFDSIPEDVFIERYLEFLNSQEISLKNIYSALFSSAMSPESFAKGNKLIIQKRAFENELGAIQLNKVFPEARFVHIIRDPRTRYISSKMRRFRRIWGITPRWTANLNGKDFATAISEISMVTLELARLNKKILGDKYHVVLYEDLIKDPDKEMRKIADHLGIEFNESLLTQTVNRKKKKAESSFKELVPGIQDMSRKRLDFFYKDTSSLERKIVSFLTWDAAQYFNYDVEPVQKLNECDFFIPLKWETPINYLKNRIWMQMNLRGYSATIKVRLFQKILNKFDQGEQTGD